MFPEMSLSLENCLNSFSRQTLSSSRVCRRNFYELKKNDRFELLCTNHVIFKPYGSKLNSECYDLL